MKKAILGAAAAATLGAMASAGAADLSYRPPQQSFTVNQPLNAFSWAGPYLGGNLGYAWGSVSNSPTKPSGINGGVQIGYNWQSGQWVYGVEGDIQASGAEDRFAGWKFSNPWFGTLRGRFGFALNNILLYGTGGLAFGALNADLLGRTESHTTAGWTLGAGAEVGLAPNWSAKVEYLYVDLSTQNFALTGANNGYHFGLLRLGANYHF
jgi:outer membrane immunogenic protein